MPKINCENKNPKKPIDLSRIIKIAHGTLVELGRKECEINIVFISNQKIRAMNRRYLGIDASTDVLAFREVESEPGQEGFLGDIAISSDKALQNAKEYGTTFIEETALYIIHGILHLTGHEDRTKNGRACMRKEENRLFQKIRRLWSP